MLRTTSTSSRAVRGIILGLATLTTALVFTVDTADAGRKKRPRHNVARAYTYNPAFATIIVDGNSGSVLSSNNPDASRHPASLTKIMTLYMLFERLESGKIKLDSGMDVSAHASRQAPTKLGLRPGQTLQVEDAIKALVTRSANDAAVVIAEALGGDEDDFAKQMTQKARSLGMTRTVYRNASGLPDSDQVTTARDQATLGRAIQERFPRYYRYFATSSFVYRGRAIRNHNRLIGTVEGVDGIKTGYTRASGFNLVTSIRRGNRHLVGVVLGGRSGSARDATMRSLLASNLERGATRRTVAAISERSPAEANSEVAEVAAKTRPTKSVQVDGAVQIAAAVPTVIDETPVRPAAPVAPITRSAGLIPPASVPSPANRPEPAPMTSGVIQSNSIAIPGASEPMKPVRIRTVQVKSGQTRVATAASLATRNDQPEISGSLSARAEMPPQPANHGTGQGLLGVLPGSGSRSPQPQQLAYADPAPTTAPQTEAVQQAGAIKPTVNHTGWIIQVGALESESQARIRLDEARAQARGMLSKADPFTETVASRGDKMLYRARFAGLERNQAEAVCKTLKRSDISCITIKN